MGATIGVGCGYLYSIKDSGAEKHVEQFEGSLDGVEDIEKVQNVVEVV